MQSSRKCGWSVAGRYVASVSQLVDDVKCGLPRTNQICAAIARVGDADFLQCALIYGYPWTGSNQPPSARSHVRQERTTGVGQARLRRVSAGRSPRGMCYTCTAPCALLGNVASTETICCSCSVSRSSSLVGGRPTSSLLIQSLPVARRAFVW